MNDEPTEPALTELAARLDDVSKELRRQGRAAIAAQAAAEACLEALTSHARAADPIHDATSGVEWLNALLPVADALDRIVAHTAAMVEHGKHSSRLYRWFCAWQTPSNSDLFALLQGVRLLRAQLEAALGDLGVTIDRRIGVPFDPALHRAVEVRAEKADATALVLEVVRPGYALGECVVREADVVTTTQEE